MGGCSGAAAGTSADGAVEGLLAQALANELELHCATLNNTANALIGTWNGEAATSYQTLSRRAAAVYSYTAGSARGAGSALAAFAKTLEACQQAGSAALRGAEFWLAEQNQWQERLNTAKAAVAAAM
jgi:hypothetical protein